jgi:lyso-ornithine lipid O-acyltransferase
MRDIILSGFAVLKLLILCVWTLPLVLLQIILLLFHKGAFAYTIPHLWHKGLCFILGVEIVSTGNIKTQGQTLFMSNHFSDLDIPVLGSLIQASFVAKEDIASWPVVGFLAKTQQTAFISRASRSAEETTQSLKSMLQQGKSLILFPEGTTSNSTIVLPFKSSLFQLVLDSDLVPAPALQPVTLSLLEVNYKPVLTQSDRDQCALYGDTNTAHHMWNVFKCRHFKIKVQFHEPVYDYQELDRKTLALKIQKIVESGLETSKISD